MRNPRLLIIGESHHDLETISRYPAILEQLFRQGYTQLFLERSSFSVDKYNAVNRGEESEEKIRESLKLDTGYCLQTNPKNKKRYLDLTIDYLKKAKKLGFTFTGVDNAEIYTVKNPTLRSLINGVISTFSDIKKFTPRKTHALWNKCINSLSNVLLNMDKRDDDMSRNLLSKLYGQKRGVLITGKNHLGASDWDIDASQILKEEKFSLYYREGIPARLRNAGIETISIITLSESVQATNVRRLSLNIKNHRLLLFDLLTAIWIKCLKN
jgi:hypothetical protein